MVINYDLGDVEIVVQATFTFLETYGFNDIGVICRKDESDIFLQSSCNAIDHALRVSHTVTRFLISSDDSVSKTCVHDLAMARTVSRGRNYVFHAIFGIRK